MDLWEPAEGDGDEPMVHHGGTLTSKLLLSSVLSVIDVRFLLLRMRLLIRNTFRNLLSSARGMSEFLLLYNGGK